MNKLSELFNWFGYLMLACAVVGLFFLIMTIGAVVVSVIGIFLVIFIVAFLIKEIAAERKKKGPN